MEQTRICQCCGMPMTPDLMSREPDGTVNEEYCKFCYADGKFTYSNMDDLIDFCVNNVKPAEFTAEELRTYMSQLLPQLKHWKKA